MLYFDIYNIHTAKLTFIKFFIYSFTFDYIRTYLYIKSKKSLQKYTLLQKAVFSASKYFRVAKYQPHPPTFTAQKREVVPKF